jgi:uncharacterized membrane protein YbhN (UPF0104 family)
MGTPTEKREPQEAEPRDVEEAMPEELNPRRIGRRIIEIGVIVALIALLVLTGPGLGSVRHRITHASAGWLTAALAAEFVSTLCYVLVFRSVFCPRMRWGMSYLIGMSEQAANVLLPASGTGGLALGAWALRRGGMSTDHIARKTVAFFFLTSLANVAGLIGFALLYATHILHHDRNPILTYAFAGAALIASALVLLGLPRLRPAAVPLPPGAGRLARALRLARNSLGVGLRDGLHLLRERPVSILVGSFGLTAFDLATLGFAFRAFHYAPSVGMLAIGYLIGQLGGNIPLPGGLVGLDVGLIGTFVLLHQPLAPTSAAVLIYHAISLWLPAIIGSVTFVRLRHILQREDQPAAVCLPLAEPAETVRLPARAPSRA